MSRGRAFDHQVLADLLCEDTAEICCHDCGRRRRHAVEALFERLASHDWDVPLHVAARSLRCSDCGVRDAQIVLRQPLPRQVHLRLVPAQGDQ